MGQFKFKDKVAISQGRNGLLNTTGVSIYKSYGRLDSNNNVYDNVRIYPITSRDTEGNCWIEVPVDEIENFIEQLKKYVPSKP